MGNMVGGFNDVLESIVFLWACCDVVWEFSGAPYPCLENQGALFSLMTLKKVTVCDIRGEPHELSHDHDWFVTGFYQTQPRLFFP